MVQRKLMFPSLSLQKLFQVKVENLLHSTRYNQDLLGYSLLFTDFHSCYGADLQFKFYASYQNSELSILNLRLLICGLMGAGHPLLLVRRRFCKSLVPKEPHLGGGLV